MRVCVIGSGYVGLVTGACLSDSGNHVVCLDVDKEKIASLQKGKMPFFEPGLEELVIANAAAKRLTFTHDPAQAIRPSEIIFITVGTPSRDNGTLDLQYVLTAMGYVREHIRQDALVVLKSTVPVGTADKAREMFRGLPYKIDVVSNPEFLTQATAVDDFMRPERVIVGCDSDHARRIMADLYAPYVRSGNPILFMDNRSAELSKYAANSFLAMKISFINEIANLSEACAADVQQVRRVLTSDSRIGKKFLYPGCGYGGSCFPKDVQAMIHFGETYSMEMELFRAIHDVNESQKRILFKKINRHFGSDLKNKTLALWGLSFKPRTDDMREAPSVVLISQLLEAGCKVRAYDPIARETAHKIFENKISLYEDPYECCRRADALVVLTEWNEFRSPDFALLKKEMNHPVIFDGRNLYQPESLAYLGFSYYCIGRQDPK